MYHFRLQRTDGSPFDPPTYRCSTLSWRQGDTIMLTPDRTLRVLGVRDDDADQPPALVVEDLPDWAMSSDTRASRPAALLALAGASARRPAPLLLLGTTRCEL